MNQRLIHQREWGTIFASLFLEQIQYPFKNLFRTLFLFGILILNIGCSGIKTNSDENLPAFDSTSVMLGGETTVYRQNREAFGAFARNLDEKYMTPFFVGRSLFTQSWVTPPASTTARDGLGPLFNSRACSGCHFQDGRGRPPELGDNFASMLLRISIPGVGEHGGPVPEPTYGGQLNGRAISGVAPEGREVVEYTEIPGSFPDGESYSLRMPTYRIENLGYGDLHPETMISPRVAPVVVGLGLLEAISEEDLLEYSDPDDQNQDGISGKPNMVWNVKLQKKQIGRFGWKAGQPTVEQQVAGAFLGDMGLTTFLFPNEAPTPNQNLGHLPNGGEPEVIDEHLETVVIYSSSLAVPVQRNGDSDNVRQGSFLFEQVGCTACHVRSYTTKKELGENIPKAFANQVIYPYTDLLLHDMGDSLGDGRPDFQANGNEWRTPPLWGIGLVETVNQHTLFLHDGRARSLEEAILWHGGEGTASREQYMNLSKEKRNLLIDFLESL